MKWQKMTSYIDDAENYETYREIEDIKVNRNI